LARTLKPKVLLRAQRGNDTMLGLPRFARNQTVSQ